MSVSEVIVRGEHRIGQHNTIRGLITIIKSPFCLICSKYVTHCKSFLSLTNWFFIYIYDSCCSIQSKKPKSRSHSHNHGTRFADMVLVDCVLERSCKYCVVTTLFVHKKKSLDKGASLFVVVRAYHKQTEMLGRLARSLMSKSNDVMFIVVPTDLESGPLLETEVLRLYDLGVPIHLLKLSDPQKWFQAEETRDPKCPHDLSMEEFISGLCDPFEKFDPTCRRALMKSVDNINERISKVCGYTNSVHYTLTDMGLRLVDNLCPQCDFALITNGDNVYSPDFFLKVVQAEKDVVATWFETGSEDKRRVVKTQFKLSKVDLGSVVVSLRLLRRTGITFRSAFPNDIIESAQISERAKSVAMKRAYHDSDWWFILAVTEEGSNGNAIVPEVLFQHN